MQDLPILNNNYFKGDFFSLGLIQFQFLLSLQQCKSALFQSSKKVSFGHPGQVDFLAGRCNFSLAQWPRAQVFCRLSKKGI